MRIDGVVAVTGGAGHIGRAIGARCAQAGASVAIIDREAQKSEAAAAELTEKHGVEAAGFAVDLSDREAIAGAPAMIERRFGRLDGLVHNAAFYDRAEGWGVPFEQESYEAWEKVMRVNLLAPFFLTQACSPVLKRSPNGSVVMIASIYGVLGPDNRVYQGTDMVCPAAYAASKGGMIQLVRWLATSLGPQVRVNAVSPGGVERGQPESFQRAYIERTPLRKFTTEEDVAEAVAFLVSRSASNITGQNIMVDAGLTAW